MLRRARRCSFGRGEHRRIGRKLRKVKRRTALPFPNVDRYRLLKAATEVFLMTHCGVELGDFERRRPRRGEPPAATGTVDAGRPRDGRCASYLTRVAGRRRRVPRRAAVPRADPAPAPRRRVVGIDDDDDEAAGVCFGILAEKLEHPCFLELIHEYWNDEGGVVQTTATPSAAVPEPDRLAAGAGPAARAGHRPAAAAQQPALGRASRTSSTGSTTVRRAYEYDHDYGLALSAKPGPPVRGADSRSRFIEAFHNLLSLCAIFYTQDDDTTVIADGFAVLNALKETHLLLTEGAHNQYGDLPWTARHEMLMYQWILVAARDARLPADADDGRLPGAVDGAGRRDEQAAGLVRHRRSLHFRDLAVFGEQLLLGIRFGDWTDVIDPNQAANWARYWRPEVQGYIHAYRAVTGIDLTQRSERSIPAYRMRQGARPARTADLIDGRPRAPSRLPRVPGPCAELQRAAEHAASSALRQPAGRSPRTRGARGGAGAGRSRRGCRPPSRRPCRDSGGRCAGRGCAGRARSPDRRRLTSRSRTASSSSGDSAVRVHLAEEVPEQREDVLRSLAQARQVQRAAGDAVVEVVAETCRSPARRRGRGWSRRRAGSALLRHVLLPTRLNVPSWMTRSSSACSGAGSSPTSSRKSVPPSASSNAPVAGADAPVNAPFSWPKNSLPDSDGTTVLQSRTTMPPLRGRGSSSWMSCATRSLPVPLSPGDQHRGVGEPRDLDGVAEHGPPGGAVAHQKLRTWRHSTSSSMICQRRSRSATCRAEFVVSHQLNTSDGAGAEESPALVVERVVGCAQSEDAPRAGV